MSDTVNEKRRAMNHDAYPDNYIRGILNSVKSIAMVGASRVNVRRAISHSNIWRSAATT